MPTPVSFEEGDDLTFRPLSQKQRKELEGYVATSIFVLDRLKAKGFPWTAFDILQAPRSGLLFSIAAAGSRLKPSGRRPPFSWEEAKAFGVLNENYRFLDLEFESIRTSHPPERAQ